MTLLRSIRRLTAGERRLVVESVVGLTISTILVRFWQFRRLAARLGRHMVESPTEQDQRARAVARQVGWAIGATARRLPWHPVCLPQALTAQWMLRRRGVPSTLYLGVSPTAQYDAHAWVRAGVLVVSGGPVRPEFVVVASFA
jgi:hypothetical protein